MRFVRVVAISLACLTTPLAGQAARPAAGVDPAKAAAIRGILDQTGFAETFKKNLLEGIAAQEKTNKDVPKEFWKRFRKRAEEALPTLQDELVVIYDRHFSKAEIDSLAAWYRTPLGRKVAGKTPAIQAEALAAGQRWGAMIGQQVAEEMQEKK